MTNHRPRIILASASPRRRDILMKHNIEFIVDVSDVDETIDETAPNKLVEELSLRKAKAVYLRHPKDIVIGADTVVATQDRILGKPKDDADAYDMIASIQGRCHFVYTGVTIMSDKILTFAQKTDVYVKAMTSEEIEEYIRTGEGRDKAGSYAIQGIFAKYIDRYDGDLENVIGLPGDAVVRALKSMWNNTYESDSSLLL